MSTTRRLMIGLLVVGAVTGCAATARAASLFPVPTVSVSGNQVTINYPRPRSPYQWPYYFSLGNSNYWMPSYLSAPSITLYAQPLVQGMGRFPLASASAGFFATRCTWNDLCSWALGYSLDALNGTYTLPYPGVTYALYLELNTDSAFLGKESNTWGNAGGSMETRTSLVGGLFYVTTPGTPPAFLQAGTDHLANLVTETNRLVAATQTLANKDTVAPAVSVAWRYGATITAASSYPLYVYASDNSGGALQMRINGGSWQAYSSVLNVPLNLGLNEVVVEVRDPSGNVGTARTWIFRR